MKKQYLKDLNDLGNALIEARKTRGNRWYDAVNHFDKVLDDFEKKYGRDLWYEEQRLKLITIPTFHNGQLEKSIKQSFK